jgi:hypothetical protein
VFEDVVDLWKEYTTKHAQGWALDDQRQDRSAEVRERLVQIDIVLDYLKTALGRFFGDPAKAQRKLKWMIEAKARLDAGEITSEQYYAELSTPESPEQLRTLVRASDEVRLFTEMFYFVAWRLKEAFTTGGPSKFHGFDNFNPRGVNFVRNHLLEHPDRFGGNFRQHVVITHAGPVLKSSTMVIRTETGRTEPDSESVDRGLFVNAQEFHEELLGRLRSALS